MRLAKLYAILIIFAQISEGAVIQAKEKAEAAEERRLMLGQVGVALAGFLTGFLLGKYLNSKSPTHWKDDKEWERRFLQISSNENLTMQFMTLILDSFAMDLTNACLRYYHKGFEEYVKSVDQMSIDSTAKNDLKKNGWNELDANVGYCSDFFKYVVSHGFLTKYFMNSQYAIFYFGQSFMGGVGEENGSLVKFLKTMAWEIENNPLFKKIEEAHQNYFYITVNYLLDAQENLKQTKV